MKKYAVVGTGGRVAMFLDPLAGRFRDAASIVGLCDVSAGRMRYHANRLRETFSYPEVPMYLAGEFGRMLSETKPDCVIVCTVDATHCEYVLRSLAAGCEVICEKPIATEAEQCAKILDAVGDDGHRLRVALNFRWSPGVTKVCEILRSGRIGGLVHVDFEYLLDTSHGADYFRRWHATIAQSGGLLVHKSTHHFDLVNWWVDSIPRRVAASGRLAYYGRDNALRRGDEAWTRYARYTGTDCEGDPFRLDLSEDETLKALYLDPEPDNGYQRDRNVFRDGIDIYDTMSVLVDYRNGATLAYSLNAFCPYEGFRAAFTGDRGRIEYREVHGSHLIRGQSDEALAKEQAAQDGGTAQRALTVFPHFGDAYDVAVEEAPGAHGGADPLIQEQMFATDPPRDPWGRGAGPAQAVASAMVGIAANRSIARGAFVEIEDLVALAPSATALSDVW